MYMYMYVCMYYMYIYIYIWKVKGLGSEAIYLMCIYIYVVYKPIYVQPHKDADHFVVLRPVPRSCSAPHPCARTCAEYHR